MCDKRQCVPTAAGFVLISEWVRVLGGHLWEEGVFTCMA